IGVIDRGPDEEGTASENMSSEVVNEDRSVEAVNEERSVNMTDKPVVGGEVAKTKTTEVPETAKVPEITSAEVPEPAITETVTTTAPPRRAGGRRYREGRNSGRAPCPIRECKSGDCWGGYRKVMLERWPPLWPAQIPANRRAAGVKARHETATFRQNDW